MAETVEDLERRIGALRTAVRHAVLGGDRAGARRLRAELRAAEQAWEELLGDAGGDKDGDRNGREPLGTPPGQAGQASTLLPLREQVHQALSLLTVPAAPKLIATVHQAFFATTFVSSRLTSLKRDEERSFRLAPYARPYYICAALNAERLTPARGLLAVSTWPLERRMIGPLSPRTDFLTSAIRVADAIERLPGQADATQAQRLLYRFAANIPGAPARSVTMDTRAVIAAAEAELEVHQASDDRTRKAAARRAADQLDDAGQLFGADLLGVTERRGSG